MPKNDITPPIASASTDRLNLGEARVRPSFTEAANYNLCGGCGNGLSGCFEVETSGSLDQWGLQVCSCAEACE